LAFNPGVVGVQRRVPHQPVHLGSGPLVTFARAGLSVAFDEEKLSLLEMAEACDVPTQWSCRTGVCHTCATGLLSGAVRYSPTPLTPPDVTDVLLCCARPAADVVLDL
jgi:ferredoxin